MHFDLNHTTADPSHLRELVIRLAEAKRNVSEHAYALKVTQAEAEQRVIIAAGGDPKALGATEADRARTLLLHVSKDDAYLVARAELAEAEAVLSEREADLEAYRDARSRDSQESRWALAMAGVEAAA